MKTVITDPEAQAELEAAAAWYEERKEGLGTLFVDSVAEAVASIQKSPKAFPLFQDTTIRKYAMQRLPYIVFYEEMHAHIWIYAFAHTKRRPGYWLKRVVDDETKDEE